MQEHSNFHNKKKGKFLFLCKFLQVMFIEKLSALFNVRASKIALKLAVVLVKLKSSISLPVREVDI